MSEIQKERSKSQVTSHKLASCWLMIIWAVVLPSNITTKTTLTKMQLLHEAFSIHHVLLLRISLTCSSSYQSCFRIHEAPPMIQFPFACVFDRIFSKNLFGFRHIFLWLKKCTRLLGFNYITSSLSCLDRSSFLTRFWTCKSNCYVVLLLTTWFSSVSITSFSACILFLRIHA